jgi:hypothetical protein
VLAQWFPERNWAIEDHERHLSLGTVRERSGFVPHGRIPAEVLACRRSSRRYEFEDEARAETVLWHHKTCRVDVDPVAVSNRRFAGVREIFRLNLARWLEHTDDPNRKIMFADPDDQHIYTALAKRVYNISIVYRLRRGNDVEPWRRIRVVVNRKGIVRVDRVAMDRSSLE